MSSNVMDPVRFQQMCWPHVKLYDKQREIMYSVRENDETIVVAGNQLGKDFICALIAIDHMCTRSPARCLTSSVQYDQLNDVLWGEIRNFLESTAVELPLQYNHMRIRRKRKDGSFVPLSELTGQTVSKGEALLGRHLPRTGTAGDLQDIPRTLLIIDEASGFDDKAYEKTDTWAHRRLVIGNPFECQNFFRRAVQEGDIPRENGKGYHRKVIRITADDSPNVRYAKAEIAKGKEPSNKILIPGVKDWLTYQRHRKLWDPIMQCIGLDAEFYEGADLLMYPPLWLNAAEEMARNLQGVQRKAQTIGVDPAEGRDKSSWCICDHQGIIKLIPMKTPNTNIIPLKTIALIKQYQVDPENVLFDRGGGGKQHADRLRAMGYNVQTVGFGEGVTPERKRGMTHLEIKKLQDEEHYTFKDRRAEMAHLVRQRLDPENNLVSIKREMESEVSLFKEFTGQWEHNYKSSAPVFAIPKEYNELRKQMSVIPLTMDKVGRYTLLPKTNPEKRKPGEPETDQKTLTGLIGHSPDEFDSLMLAVYGLSKKPRTITIGAG